MATVGGGIAGWGDARVLVWPAPGPPTFAVTTSARGAGTVEIAPALPRYQKGELARLVATPARWHGFDRWDDGNTNSTRLISVESNAHHTAQFQPAVLLETLTFGGISRTAPMGMPAVFVDGEFIVAGTATRSRSALVNMTTTLDQGMILYALEEAGSVTPFQFATGAVTLAQSAILHTFAVSRDFSELVAGDPVAVSIVPFYPLVTTAPGGGTIAVVPSPGPYPSNTTVTLTAVPASGWRFLEWKGAAAGSNHGLTIVMTRPKAVEAVFGTVLRAGKLGAGSVRLDPDPPFHPFGSAPRLTAVPEAGYYFMQWGNDLTTNSNPITFAITRANPIVTALFLPLLNNQVALTVLESGEGTVTRSPAGNVHTNGQEIVLTAVPAAGFAFDGWSGDAAGFRNPLVITLTGSQTVGAQFVRALRMTVELRPAGCLLRLTSHEDAMYAFEASADLRSW